jgi:hypothetical protein
VNVGREVEVFARGGEVARRVPVAPRFTPRIPCFLQHIPTEENTIEQCYFFLTMSNPDRVRLLTRHRRCFGCFLASAVVNHELKNCPERLYCAICKSPAHNQVLCAPRKVGRRGAAGIGVMAVFERERGSFQEVPLIQIRTCCDPTL